jgi:hypothetical protein
VIQFIVMFGIATAIAAAILSARDRRRKRIAQERAHAFALQQAAEEARRQAEIAEHAARMRAQRLAEIAARREQLTKRFGAEVGERILNGDIWQGATVEMLVEARGKPEEIDERVMAKKTKHVYKYGQLGKNRYRLRVTLENGVVVGWEEKG